MPNLGPCPVYVSQKSAWVLTHFFPADVGAYVGAGCGFVGPLLSHFRPHIAFRVPKMDVETSRNP